MPADQALKQDGRQTTQADDKSLQDALGRGVVSRAQARVVHARAPGPLLRRADGLDIVKKSSSRKGRCLLVFSCQLSLVPGGELGELTGMDCDNPVLYMSFPSGRLKLLGSVLHPKNKYMVLKMGSKQNVLCEHVFEHMIVFYKMFWIGTTSENPAEDPLPMPDEIQKPPENSTDTEKALDFGRGLGLSDGDDLAQGSQAEAAAPEPAAEPSPGRQLRTRARQNAVRIVDSSDDGADSDAYSEHDDVSNDSAGASSHGDDAASDGSEDADEPASANEGDVPDAEANGSGAAKAVPRGHGASKSPCKGRAQERNGAASPAVTPQKRQRGQRGAPDSGDTPAATTNSTPPKSDRTPQPKRAKSGRTAGKGTPASRPAARTPKKAAQKGRKDPPGLAATPKAEAAAEKRRGDGAAATRPPSERRTPRRAAARLSYAEASGSGSEAQPQESGDGECADGEDAADTQQGSDDAMSD